ncbi:transcriptional antiterminator, partial [Pseudomonas aeruginosa]
GGGKEEYLEVAVEGATLLLRLDRLLAITALTEAALFGRIRLREEACSRASGMPPSHLGN